VIAVTALAHDWKHTIDNTSNAFAAAARPNAPRAA